MVAPEANKYHIMVQPGADSTADSVLLDGLSFCDQTGERPSCTARGGWCQQMRKLLLLAAVGCAVTLAPQYSGR